jgi:hypothetical protein
MRDLMIDLETLSTRPDAMVIAIGAVGFGPEGLGQEFYAAIRPGTAMGHIDERTVAWWMGQSNEARSVFREDNTDSLSLAAALQAFGAFVRSFGPDLRIWGHGSSFDLPIIESAFRACGHPLPWGHRAARDTRTIFDLTGTKVVMPETAKHNALSDARAQAAAVISAASQLGSHRLWRLGQA